MSLLRDIVRKHATERRIQRAQYMGLAVVDAVDRVRGRTDPELPPKRLRHFVGAGDFRATGEEFVAHARRLVSLEPADRVLDIGSGIGRIALPLTRVLDSSGGYDGIEIVKSGVDWCRDNITAKHPNFRFHHSDIYNGTYNPDGRLKPEDYRFPFDDDTFDVVILTSVFTHLLPETIEHYVAEISRTLRPGGRVLATFFVLDDESLRLLDAGRSEIPMPESLDGGVRVMGRETPEAAISFPEDWVRGVFARHGMNVREVHRGTWCGRPEGLSTQDVVIAVPQPA